MFKIVPGNACYTEFFVPEMNLNIVPLPERAMLKGNNASFYQVEQVSSKLNCPLYLVQMHSLFLQEEIETEFYKKVIFYDIQKTPQLPQTVSLLEKSAKSMILLNKVFGKSTKTNSTQ